MTAPQLTLLPPLEPAPPLEGQALEDAARAELNHAIRLDVQVNAPSWRQVLFGARRVKFQIPKPPEASLKLLGQIKPPESLPKDNVGITALGLAEGLQQAKPEGFVPAAITAVPALPASRDAISTWLRRVFLVTAGPAALPLLVAAGYLTPGDVATLDETYPEGVDEQRKAAVEAGMAVTTAGARTGNTVELPGWLNDQLLTLMGEPRDTEAYQDLYTQAEKPAGGTSTLGGQPSRIAEQTAPDTIKGDFA